MNNNLNPQDLAQKASDDIMKNLSTDNVDGILQTLENHYETLQKTQELQIELLSEFINNLKHLQKKDRESLDFLKQRVLNHVLKNR